MNKIGMVCVLVMCLAVVGFSSTPINTMAIRLEAFSEQEAGYLREDFTDVAKLRKWMMGKGLPSCLPDSGEVEKFKEKFGVSDEILQVVLMDIIRELSAKTRWISHHEQRESRDIYLANMLLIEAVKWMGSCADTAGKKLLMDIVMDKTKEEYFRWPAIRSYLCRADAQEVQNTVARFLAGDVGETLRLSDIYCAAIWAYDVAKDDTPKREALVTAMSIALVKENNKDTFAYADRLLAERSKEYADSPQRKAALERLNIPAEKGEQ